MFDYSRFLEQGGQGLPLASVEEPRLGQLAGPEGGPREDHREAQGEKGGNIIIEGGPRLIHEVLRLNLADDYWFLVMPVVFGRGPRYWYPMKAQTTLKLLSSSTMKYGELVLHYEAVREKAASKSK